MPLKFRKILFFALSALIIIIAAGLMFILKDKAVLQGLFLGIIASIIASIVYSFISSFINSEVGSSKEEIGAIQKELHTLREHIFKKNEYEELGIAALASKARYDTEAEFWLGLLEEAEDGFELLGHALNKWFYKEYHEKYVERILWLVNNNKTVQLVFLAPDGNSIERVNKQYHKDYTIPARDTLEKIESEIKGKIKKNHQKYLQIKLIKETEIHYMYISTGKSIVIAPYNMAANDGCETFIMKLNFKSKLGIMFHDDYGRFFNHGR
jgi:hypothetical protein